jgi:hypothetical protein
LKGRSDAPARKQKCDKSDNGSNQKTLVHIQVSKVHTHGAFLTFSRH